MAKPKPEISLKAVRARAKAKGYDPTPKQVRATYNRDVARRQKGSKAKFSTAPMQRPVTKKQTPAARPAPHGAFRPGHGAPNVPAAPAPTTKKVRPMPNPRLGRPRPDAKPILREFNRARVGPIVTDNFAAQKKGYVKKMPTRKPVMPKRGS